MFGATRTCLSSSVGDCMLFAIGIGGVVFVSGDIERAGEQGCRGSSVEGKGSEDVTEGDVGDASVLVLGTGEEVEETVAIVAPRLLLSPTVFLEGLVLVSLTPTRRPAPLRPRSLLPVLSALPFTRCTPLRP